MWRLEVVLVWRFQREQHWACFRGHWHEVASTHVCVRFEDGGGMLCHALEGRKFK